MIYKVEAMHILHINFVLLWIIEITFNVWTVDFKVYNIKLFIGDNDSKLHENRALSPLDFWFVLCLHLFFNRMHGLLQSRQILY